MATVSYTADLDDLDNVPEEDKPTSSPRLIMWLVVAGLGLLLLPLFQISAAIQDDNLVLESQVADIQATLASTPRPQPTNQALKEKLIQLQKQTSALEGIQPTLAAGHVDWLTTLNVIAGYDPAQITLTGLSQPDSRLVLSGQADDENMAMNYAQMLRDSGQFERVIVQSITSRILPTSISDRAAANALNGNVKADNKVAEFTISLELKKHSSDPATK